MDKSKVMRKVAVVGSFILVCSMLLVASGCSKDSDEAAAIRVGEDLKKKQYEIQVPAIAKENTTVEQDVEDILKEQEEYKPFLTEKGYEAFTVNRQSAIATIYAAKNKVNMKINKIEFENMNQANMEKDTFSFRYSVDIELSPSEMTSSRGTSVVTKTGHMTVVKENDVWKVLKDNDNGFIGEE